ncbi:hypothetical protein C8J56DRAFT_846601 [Mycena floridula]|nr:hypothetical protein C8J56DRAFT_846601 [Mycena floridula]
MDADRKSTVSSFYGRKSSLDALNSDYPTSNPVNFDGHHTPAPGRDDASSFFNPDRASRNLDGGDKFGSAGYNRNSFFQPGREEPLKGGRDEEEPVTPGWDIYADFNNAGPRYASAFGQGNDGYQPLEGMPKAETAAASGPVELVTVPALGPEWQRSEMRDMTKAGRREKKADSRRERWKAWNRDKSGMCGGYLKRKTVVFIVAAVVVILVILLIFTLPRVPSFSFDSAHPLAAATGAFNASVPIAFSPAPANFSFPAFANLQLDTGSSFLPLRFTHLKAQVFDLNTGRLVGTGDLGHKTVPAKSFPVVQVPITFGYAATNTSDQTWANWHNACINKLNQPNGTRPGVDFRLVVSMSLVGLIGSHSDSTQITNAACPIELPTNAP